MEQSHILNLMFTNGTAAPTTAAGSSITAYTSMTDGEVQMCNDQNLILDATTCLSNARVLDYGVKFVGRNGTKLIHSDLIKSEDIIRYNVVATAAAAEQVTYIGYTGSGNSISVINDNVYKLNLQFDTIGRTGRGNTVPVDIMYKSDAAATQTSVAFGLLGNLVPSLAKMTESPCVVRLINSAALVANDRFTSWVAGVKGSKFLTFQTNMATTSVLTIAVGDLIRIGDASDDVTSAVALGSTVYKVITIVSGTVLEIDRPFTGASGTATASTDCSLIPIATAGNYGIRIDGVAPTWVLGKRPWNKNTFTVGLTDFGSTLVTYSTAASLGKGLINQMKDLEWFCLGESGNKYRGDYMNPSYTSQATAATYHQACFLYADKGRNEGIGGPNNNPKQLIIATDTSYHATDTTDLLWTALDAFTGVTSLYNI
jgi:hypothetical protein